MPKCLRCEAEFEPNHVASGPKAKVYCSERCRTQAASARTQEKLKLNRAQRLALAGKLAPTARSLAPKRKIHVTNAQGEVVRVISDQDLAKGLLARADVELSTLPGEIRKSMLCQVCAKVILSPQPRQKRCSQCSHGVCACGMPLTNIRGKQCMPCFRARRKAEAEAKYQAAKRTCACGREETINAVVVRCYEVLAEPYECKFCGRAKNGNRREGLKDTPEANYMRAYQRARRQAIYEARSPHTANIA